MERQGLGYAIRTEEVRRLIARTGSVLGVRIVLYGPDHRKLREFDLTGDTTYCRALRADRAFAQRCRACDREHLDEARRRRSTVAYTCHHGLRECIIPLFDEARAYLGAIAFGQIRPAGRAVPQPNARMRRLYQALPAYGERRMLEIADLLEYLCTYILQNQLIRSRPATWAERVAAYVREHGQERLTVDELAAAAGCSRSFLTHRFGPQFGCTLRQYVQRARMRQAQVLLQKGCSVKETAYRLGFCDQFHFSKAYKAWSGRPPSAVGE
jgi:AraC-like DNA-binding protein